MATINWTTRQKGFVTTSQGKINIIIKKPFKQSQNYQLFIDDNKHLTRSTVQACKEYVIEIVRTWS